jgi:hypothetical protein
MTNCGPDTPVGSDPANVKWSVVRGDSATLRVEFFEDDGVTKSSTSGWLAVASTYDYRGDVIDELETQVGDGYVDIIISPETSRLWGVGYRPIAADLGFDLQITLSNQTVWTPVLGSISVIADISGSL